MLHLYITCLVVFGIPAFSIYLFLKGSKLRPKKSSKRWRILCLLPALIYLVPGVDSEEFYIGRPINKALEAKVIVPSRLMDKATWMKPYDEILEKIKSGVNVKNAYKGKFDKLLVVITGADEGLGGICTLSVDYKFGHDKKILLLKGRDDKDSYYIDHQFFYDGMSKLIVFTKSSHSRPLTKPFFTVAYKGGGASFNYLRKTFKAQSFGYGGSDTQIVSIPYSSEEPCEEIPLYKLNMITDSAWMHNNHEPIHQLRHDLWSRKKASTTIKETSFSPLWYRFNLSAYVVFFVAVVGTLIYRVKALPLGIIIGALTILLTMFVSDLKKTNKHLNNLSNSEISIGAWNHNLKEANRTTFFQRRNRMMYKDLLATVNEYQFQPLFASTRLLQYSGYPKLNDINSNSSENVIEMNFIHNGKKTTCFSLFSEVNKRTYRHSSYYERFNDHKDIIAQMIINEIKRGAVHDKWIVNMKYLQVAPITRELGAQELEPFIEEEYQKFEQLLSSKPLAFLGDNHEQ